MRKLSILLVLLAVILTACATPATKPENMNADMRVAVQMSSFFYNMQAIEHYYDDGMAAMASVKASSATLARNSGAGKSAALLMACYPLWNAHPSLPGQQSGQYIPPEFLEPLPPTGAIAAPPGACPAAAKPSVTFITAGGEPVNPQLLASKYLQAIPTEMVTMAQGGSGSLLATINAMVPMGDRSLASPEGWNTLLWDQLKAMQTPSQSLMDYQLWNASPEIEQQITDQFRQRLQSVGVPPVVIEAFNNSDKAGWYSSSQPTPEDALARMDILAEMTGSVSGTVHEQRDFSLLGAGQKPVFGLQTGEGTVTFDHPELGLMTFTVDILLDRFDEQGRAINGTVVAVDAEQGYTVRFIFQPDGSKKGEVLKDGEVVGLLTMTTDADKFQNYVDVQTNQSLPLPAPPRQ